MLCNVTLKSIENKVSCHRLYPLDEINYLKIKTKTFCNLVRITGNKPKLSSKGMP